MKMQLHIASTDNCTTCDINFQNYFIMRGNEQFLKVLADIISVDYAGHFASTYIYILCDKHK